jgi:xanthine/uracil permease
MAAGFLSILFAPLAARLLRFFRPIVAGIVITAIGLAIVQVGINWAAGGVGNPEYDNPIFLGTSLAVLVFILLITRYVRGFIANISVLLGIVFGFVIALLLGRVSFQGVADAPWLDIVLPFHFGLPTFDPLSILTLNIVQVVIFIESTGMFLALGEMVEKPVAEREVMRGLRADGLATLTGGSWVTAVSGVIPIAFGLVPKMAIVVASIPKFELGGPGVVMLWDGPRYWDPDPSHGRLCQQPVQRLHCGR